MQYIFAKNPSIDLLLKLKLIKDVNQKEFNHKAEKSKWIQAVKIFISQ